MPFIVTKTIKFSLLSLLVILCGCGQPTSKENSSLTLPISNDNEKRVRYAHEYYTHQYDATLIDGVIDQKFLQKMSQLPKGSNALVYSKGGASQIAIDVANHIKENEISIFIIGTCTSACSEFLSPAAKKITFIEQPLIGFHGNTVAYMSFVEKKFGDKLQYCSSVHALKTKVFLLETLGRDDFWKHQYKFMEIKEVTYESVKTKSGYKCIKPNIETKQTIWYPNSTQLRDLYGIKFLGGVCADNEACFQDRLTKIYEPLTSIAVGENVFVIDE